MAEDRLGRAERGGCGAACDRCGRPARRRRQLPAAEFRDVGRRPPRRRPDPLALLVTAAVFYDRLRAGARATIALLAGWLGVLGGIEAIHYTRAVGPSGDDYTGLPSIPAGLVLIGLGVVTLWRSRRRDDRLWWRYSRRLLTVATAVFASFALFTTSIAYVITHVARAHVPAADLGAPYEEVEFTTSDGLRLKGWYIESRNGARR